MSTAIRAIYILLILCSCISYSTEAKIFPAEGAQLNYRLVGFSFPEAANSASYQVEIAKGTIEDEAKFVAVLTSAVSASSKIITEVPSFGAVYTWRVVYNGGSKDEYKGKLYHFSTGVLPLIGASTSRLRILKPQQNKLNSYIMLNGSRTMYDMSGNPVWFLPDLEGANSSVCDIKQTPQHTLTLLYNSNAYEVNYNGNILWKAPGLAPAGTPGAAPDELMAYHHEFSRLANGHYMALGCALHTARTSAMRDENALGEKSRFRFFASTMNTSLFEFDAAGKVVWLWNAGKYLIQSDIYEFLKDNFDQVPIDAHENSFCFDNATHEIYLSLCSFNRILKISYPSGKVVNAYGTIYKAGSPGRQDPGPGFHMGHELQNGLFCGQHSCSKFSDGNIYLYNNQFCAPGSKPQVLALREPGTESNSLQKVWQLDCNTDDCKGEGQGGGGCIKPLQDGSLFVLMNTPYSKAFIVNKDKEVQWSAICEMKDEITGNWNTAPSYRASIISQDELEHIIWNSELAIAN